MKVSALFARAVELVGGKSPSPRAEVEQALRDSEATASAAKAECARLAEQRPELLVTGSDTEIETLDAGAAKAALQRDRAVAIASKLRERLAILAAEDAAAARDRQRSEVELECELAAQAVRERYPKVVTEPRALLRTLAKAQAARDAFARAYPDEPALPDPEMVARRPESSQADEILSERKEWRWIDGAGKVLDPNYVRREVRIRLTAQQRAEVEKARAEQYKRTGSQILPKPLDAVDVTPELLEKVKSGHAVGVAFETTLRVQVSFVEVLRREISRPPTTPQPNSLANAIKLPSFDGTDAHDAWQPTIASFRTGAEVLAEFEKAKPAGRKHAVASENIVLTALA